MSDSDDSETAEWEREQMLRGTQSRGRQHDDRHQSKHQTSDVNSTVHAIDATIVKKHVMDEIERAERDVEDSKRSIATTRISIVNSEKRLDAIKKNIDRHEAIGDFFQKLINLKTADEMLDYIKSKKPKDLPQDQSEMMVLLEKLTNDKRTPMELD